MSHWHVFNTSTFALHIVWYFKKASNLYAFKCFLGLGESIEFSDLSVDILGFAVGIGFLGFKVDFLSLGVGMDVFF